MAIKGFTDGRKTSHSRLRKACENRSSVFPSKNCATRATCMWTAPWQHLTQIHTRSHRPRPGLLKLLHFVSLSFASTAGTIFSEKRKLAINQMKLYTRTLDLQGLLHLLVLWGEVESLGHGISTSSHEMISTNWKSQIETSFCSWFRWIGRRRNESEFGSTRRPTAIAHVQRFSQTASW